MFFSTSCPVSLQKTGDFLIGAAEKLKGNRYQPEEGAKGCSLRAVWFYVVAGLFFFGFFRFGLGELLYVGARYDFPAELGGFGDRLDDLRRLGGVRIAFGAWITALGVFPTGAALLLALPATLSAAWFGQIIRGPHPISRFVLLRSLLPVTCLAALPTVQSYYLFGCYSLGFFWGLFFGFFAATALGRITAAFKKGRSRLIFLVTATVVCYPLLGAFAPLGVLLAIGAETFHRSEPGYRRRQLVFVLTAILVPLGWYPFLSGRTPFSGIYTDGLVFLTALRRDAWTLGITNALIAAALISTLLPMILAMLKPMFQPMLGALFFRPKATVKKKRSRNKTERANLSSPRISPKLAAGAFWVIALLLPTALIAAARCDGNFLATLAMVRPLDERNWEKILELERRVKYPTAPMIELRRAALIMSGRAGEEYFSRPNAGVMSERLRKVSSYRIFGPEILLLTGNVAYANRIAMNDFVGLRGRSPYYLKIMFLCALTQGEYPLAERYYARWKAASFCSGECDRWREVLDAMKRAPPAPTLHDETLELRRLIESVRARIPDDFIVTTESLNRTVAESARNRTLDRLTLDDFQTQLLYFLTAGDMKRFEEQFPAFAERWQKEKGGPFPTTLQQGWIYVEFSRTKRLPPVRYPCDSALSARFASFLDSLQRGGPDERFAGTWWYYSIIEKDVPSY